MPHRFKPVNASWISKQRILVLLSHDWPYEGGMPPLHFNSQNSPILNLERAPLTSYGELTGYFREGKDITFICTVDVFENVKKTFVAGNFNGWGSAIGQEEWCLNPREIDGKRYLVLTVPWEKCHQPHIQSYFKFVTEDNVWLQVPPKAPNYETDGHNNSNYKIYPNSTGHNAFMFDPHEGYDPSRHDEILWVDEHGHHIYLIDDDVLLLGLGSEKPLGAIVEDSQTTFRLFAPRATGVKVTYYSKLDDSESKTLDLNRNDDYTWEVEYPEDLHGKYYHYTVIGDNAYAKNNFNDSFRVLDPYALATLGPGGPGVIINNKSIKKIEKPYEVPRWIDLVLLEAHIRDLVVNTIYGSEFQTPVGFRNLTEWMKGAGNYLKELGINAVELLPVQEYESGSPTEYHWGYMTTNYFCPSSCYTFGKNPISQIEEFKEAVDVLHNAGIAVILDVVYNHSGSPNHLLHIDKDYYFESTKEGALMNWCGCGNDFRANTPMGRRLIIDSLVYLINTFDIDGFRFDLAELVGIEVLNEVELALKAVKPSIVLIAEPWSFRGHIGHALKSTGFASWNDGYREFIADSVLDRSNRDAFRYFMTGSTSYLASFTAQSVNYAASHDDYCWLDKITENPYHDGSAPTFHDIRRTHLMVAILMMSVGVPMLAEGQDILHSKNGHGNTYERGDLNALNYTNMVNYSGTHEYFARWVRFRLSEEGRAIRIREIPSEGYFRFFYNEGSSAIGMLYNADRSLKGVRQLFFVLNQSLEVITLNTGDINLENFIRIADQERIEIKGFDVGITSWREGVLKLSPLACGLWIERQ